mgnify:CR=1 FL=1
MNSGMASLQASPESMRYIAERLGIPLQLFSLVVCTSTSYAIIYAESIVKPIYFGGWVQKYRIDELIMLKAYNAKSILHDKIIQKKCKQ